MRRQDPEARWRRCWRAPTPFCTRTRSALRSGRPAVGFLAIDVQVSADETVSCSTMRGIAHLVLLDPQGRELPGLDGSPPTAVDTDQTTMPAEWSMEGEGNIRVQHRADRRT